MKLEEQRAKHPKDSLPPNYTNDTSLYPNKTMAKSMIFREIPKTCNKSCIITLYRNNIYI